jgi:hypothetical protein
LNVCDTALIRSEKHLASTSGISRSDHRYTTGGRTLDIIGAFVMLKVNQEKIGEQEALVLCTFSQCAI